MNICAQCGVRFILRNRSKHRPNTFCSAPCWYSFRKAMPRVGVPQSLRRLRNDEAPPSGIPKRFKTRDGYWLLRWKVGVRSYVEALEHRLIAGRHMPHVHHVNGNRTDNRLSNLQPLTQTDHAMLRATIDYIEAAELYRSGWSLPRLSRHYGLNNATMLRSLRKRGVVLRTVKESWVIRKADKDLSYDDRMAEAPLVTCASCSTDYRVQMRAPIPQPYICGRCQ